MWCFDYSHFLCHHGIKGQKWGVKNGPPYPLKKGLSNSKSNGTINSSTVQDAISSGKVSTKVNREKQLRHTLSNHKPGRSYLDGDLDFAQSLINELAGTGQPVPDRNGRWSNKERVSSKKIIGTYVTSKGEEIKTGNAMIVYSKTGSHIYPRKG